MSDCARIREALQDGMDGPIPAESKLEVTTHLAACAECREHRDGLELVRSALRALPPMPFPDAALPEIWDRTIRSGSRRDPKRTWRIDWRVAAAAAAIITALLLPSLFRPVTDSYSTADLTRAEADARRALALTAQALQRTRHAAVTEVLGAEVSPAVRKIPIRWPSAPPTDSRRSRT